MQVCARFNGGANAGHTLLVDAGCGISFWVCLGGYLGPKNRVSMALHDAACDNMIYTVYTLY